MPNKFVKTFPCSAIVRAAGLGASALVIMVMMATSPAVQSSAIIGSPIAEPRNASATPGGDKVRWKPLSDAILMLNGRAVRTWNLYEGDKKGHLLLVQLGKRVLILDLQARKIYAPPPTDFPQVGAGTEFESRSPYDSDPQISGSNWTQRDIGPAELVRVKLGDYGQTLELQIPHPIDFRGGIY
jgi:hypothetical protein